MNQALDLVRIAKDSLFERRKDFSADRYRQMNSALLVAEAEIYMSIADVGFRLAGASLVTELTSGANQTNSTANYGAARQSLFEALLLNPDNVHAKVLAADIEDRLSWLRDGSAFGGRRFYEVEPVMGSLDGQSWTPIAQLDGTIRNLNRLSEQAGNEDSAERIQALIDKFALRLERSREQRRLQIVDLSQKIADLEYRIQTGNIDAAAALKQNTQAIRDRIVLSEATRAELEERSDDLDALIAAKTKEIHDAMVALSELTNQGDLFQFRNFGKTAERVMDDTESLIEEIQQFDADGVKARAKQLEVTFKEFQTAAGTTLDLIKSEIEVLKSTQTAAERAVDEVAASIELAKSNYFEEVAKKNIENAQNEIDRLKTELDEIELNTEDEINEFTDKIYELTYGNFEREKERVEERIREVREKIDNAKQLIELFKTNKERVEEAIAAAQLAVQAAGSIPSGVIAGTAAGTFTQKPQAIMKVQELGLKIIESAQKVEMDIRKAEQIINDLDVTITEYRREFERIDFNQAKSNLEKSIKDAEKAGNGLKQGLVEKLLLARAQIESEFEKSGKRLEEGFKHSTAKLAAHKAQFEAEVEAIKANIRGVEARATAEERKARLIVGEIEVLKGDLQRLANEKAGIEASKERAAAVANTEIAELQEQADVEADQFDKLTRPLIARLNHLQNMASILISGGDTGNIHVPVHEIANAVSGVDLSVSARRRTAELDKANRLLFQFANWLYLMTRDPVALEWAITAQNAYEVEQAYQQLFEIYSSLQSTTGLATPRYFAVRLSREALSKAYSSESGNLPGVVTFTVNPSLASLSTRAPARLRPEAPEYVGVEDLSLYAPLDRYLDDTSDAAGTLRGSAEVVFAPFIESESGAHHFLWDAWVVPNWSAPNTPEVSMIGLRPVGPTYYRINEITQGHPVLRAREANYSSTSFSYERIRSQHAQAMRFVSSGARGSLIDGTLPGMNYRGILGRGLGNTWELTAPSEWSDIGSPAWSFDAIESVDIVFGYLVAPERTSGQTLSKRDVSAAVAKAQNAPRASLDCNDIGQRWLCRLAETARFKQREKKKAEALTVREQPQADVRKAHAFSKSPASRTMRLDVLNELAGAAPRGFELAQINPQDREAVPVIAHWGQTADGIESAARGVFRDLFCLTDAEAECPHRTRIDRPDFAELTHQIVRDEMLAWTDEVPTPVGPIELIRTWRGIEALYGSVNEGDEAADENARPTLLSDLREIEIDLRQVSRQMTLLRERISGPIAVARRMVTEYEMARSQIRFMRNLAAALSNTADQNDGGATVDDKNDAEKQAVVLQGLINTKLAPFNCQSAWFMAMHAKDKGVDIEDYAGVMAARLVDALEPDISYLLAKERPAELVLESFPFEECAGIFIDAKRKLDAASQAAAEADQ